MNEESNQSRNDEYPNGCKGAEPQRPLLLVHCGNNLLGSISALFCHAELIGYIFVDRKSVV